MARKEAELEEGEQEGKEEKKDEEKKEEEKKKKMEEKEKRREKKKKKMMMMILGRSTKKVQLGGVQRAGFGCETWCKEKPWSVQS